MPSLSVTFYGNTGPLDAAMTAEKAKIAGFQKAIATSSLSPEAKAAAMAKLALDEEINRKIVNNDAVRQSIRKRRIAQEMAEIAAGSGGFGWLGKAKTEAEEVGHAAASGMARAGRHAAGFRGALREAVVIVREIAEGRGLGRVLGSFSLFMQQLSSSGKLLGMGLGGWAAVAIASFAVIYERIWGIKSLIREISFDTGKIDIAVDYITKMQRRTADAANEQRAITDEVRKQTEHYRSQLQVHERLKQARAEQFEHLRRMNDLSNAPEQAKLQRGVEIDAAERRAEIADKEREVHDLRREANAKLLEADRNYGTIKTKAEDESVQKGLDARAEAAKAFLNSGGTVTEQFKEQFALKTGAISADDLEKLKVGGTDTANAFIKAANDYRDKAEQNDLARALKKELEDAAAKAMGDAAEAELSLPDMRAKAAQRDADEAAEARAKMLSGKASAELTANQRIGAYAPVAVNPLIDIGQKSLTELKGINNKMDKIKMPDTEGAFE